MDSDQILLQLRHRKWAVGIATALETQTIHMGGGVSGCVCERRLLGVGAGQGCVQRGRGAADRQTQ